MRKNKLFKKVSAFALAAAMMAGVSANVVASSDVKHDGKRCNLTPLIEVTYTLSADYGEGTATASTRVVTDYEMEELESYVELELYAMNSSGFAEGDERDEKGCRMYYDTCSEVTVDVALPTTGFYLELEALSTHDVYVNDIAYVNGVGIDNIETDTAYLSVLFN